ncbi:hypothetical protein HMI55_007300, partial [Coelomomyces lativittatus]
MEANFALFLFLLPFLCTLFAFGLPQTPFFIPPTSFNPAFSNPGIDTGFSPVLNLVNAGVSTFSNGQFLPGVINQPPQVISSLPPQVITNIPPQVISNIPNQIFSNL